MHCTTRCRSFSIISEQQAAPRAFDTIISGVQPNGAPNKPDHVVTTTLTTSEPLISEGTTPFASKHVLGPFHPGLDHMETMLPQFATVVNYRYYRILYTADVTNVNELGVMYRIKSKIDGLHPTLKTFNGFKPIHPVPFFTTIKDALDALVKYEGIGARILEYFSTDDAKDSYEETINFGTGSYARAAYWPYVIHSILQLFIAAETFPDAMEAVTTARQSRGQRNAVRVSSPRCFTCFSSRVTTDGALQRVYLRTPGIHPHTRPRKRAQPAVAWTPKYCARLSSGYRRLKSQRAFID